MRVFDSLCIYAFVVFGHGTNLELRGAEYGLAPETNKPQTLLTESRGLSPLGEGGRAFVHYGTNTVRLDSLTNRALFTNHQRTVFGRRPALSQSEYPRHSGIEAAERYEATLMRDYRLRAEQTLKWPYRQNIDDPAARMRRRGF